MFFEFSFELFEMHIYQLNQFCYAGDLYIEGKVIPRPQYRFNEQRQIRNRSRPRYDRRRETMQVERREPTQQNWNQPLSMGHQAPDN